MLSKKMIVIAIFFISLVAISGVSAAEDAGDVAAIENDTQTDVITNDITTDEMQDDALKASADDESDDVLAASNDEEILSAGDNWYVNLSYRGDISDGSPAMPFKNIKDAYDESEDGDMIHIAPGVYSGEYNIGLTIYKKIYLDQWGLDPVILDAGDYEGPIFIVDVDEIDIVGLTFKNSWYGEGPGGALYFANGLKDSAIVANFINNMATRGGAIFVNGNISNTIIEGYFYNNSAISDIELQDEEIRHGIGGAIFADFIEDCSIVCEFNSNNAVNAGGAISALVIDRSNIISSFMFNQAILGAAINAPIIRNSKIRSDFVNNTALVGGAINANIINNTEIESNFINNTADVSLELIDESIIDEVLWYLEELGLDPAIVEYIWELYETHPIDIGFGGAIAVVGILENSNITGEFVNNEGADAGGALCAIGIVNNTGISGSYQYNRAGLGGSLFLPVVKHSAITGGYMNNYAVQGGAIFANVLNVTSINATFSSNYAVPGDNELLLACGGAICIDGAAVFSSIEGTFMSNNATFGAAIGGLDFIAFSNIAGYFIDNHAIFGGAIDVVLLKYSNVAGYFLNNTAGIGGAICAMDIDTVEISAHFVNNSAFCLEEIEHYLPDDEAEYFSEYVRSMGLDKIGFGGAVAVAGLLKNSEFRGDFILNSATVGGAIFAVTLAINGHELEPVENNKFRSNFVGNGAGIGAAIYINHTSYKNKIYSNFISNVALRDGIIYMCESSEDTISNCLFMNNTAANAVVSADSSVGTNITNNIFLNSARVYDIAVNGDAKLCAYNNWFGHNSVNYKDSPKVKGIGCNNWLFLDGSANPASVSYLGSSNIVFNLFVYDNSTKSVKGKFDHTLMEPVNLTVASTNGKVDKKIVTFGDVIKFSSNGKKGTVTAAIATAQDTVEISCLPRLSGNNLVMDYLGGNYKIQVFDSNGNPVAGEVVKMTINGKTYSIKSDKKGYAKLPIRLKPKTYTITSKYKGFVLKNTLKVKNTLKAKKAFSVKKSAKKLVLKATLKWSTGKAIANKRVSFKFNGKTFTVKTNKNGIAKITLAVKLINKGKIKLTFNNNAVQLKVGKKYKMIIRYRNETVSSKLVVKK